MAITFEKVDDILTDEARENMMSKYNTERDWIKQAVIDLIADAQNGRWDYCKSVRMFDAVAEINDALNSMADTLYEYDTSYSILLEKYGKSVQQLADPE